MIKTLLFYFLITTALAGDLPDPNLTPGLADPALTKEVICDPHWHTAMVRNVSDQTKDEVYASYGMSRDKEPCPCEVDHLVPLETGGSNDKKNLWPQSYTTQPWNAHVKDKLENQLHDDVCAGKMPLAAAQWAIAKNWIKLYEFFQFTPGAK